MAEASDEYFHARSDDPYWHESAYFSFMVPERNLNGSVYFHHRPNMGYSVGGVIIWDHTADTPGDCLHYDYGDPYALTEQTEMFDFTLLNGLTVKCVEPLGIYRMTYGGDDWYRNAGCELDLQWRAAADPCDFGLPEGQDEWAKGHYQQIGQVTGTVTLAGEQIQIENWSLRDRSWGPRRIVSNPRTQYPWGIAAADHAFLAYPYSDLNPADDPIVGTVEKTRHGWYLKDGELGYLQTGEYEITKRGADGRPEAFRIDATDHHGRSFHADGHAASILKFHGYPSIWWWWPQVHWAFDGQQAWGEASDLWPLQQARRYFRAKG